MLLLICVFALMPAAPNDIDDVLPTMNGTAFPRFSQPFAAGECDRADALPTGRPVVENTP